MNDFAAITTVEDSFFSWFIANWPMTAFVIGFGAILWRLTNLLTDYKTRFIKTEQDVNGLKQDVKALRDDLNAVKLALSELIGFLKGKLGGGPDL